METFQTKRRLRPKKQLNYVLDEESEEEMETEPTEQELQIFTPSIESFHSRRRTDSGVEYLVKFIDRSFLHCEWREEKAILALDQSMKQKLNRFNRLLQTKGVLDGQLFNLDHRYKEAERVLDCSEPFPVLHVKKATEMRGKWSEKLVKTINYLVNFQIGHIQYGIYFTDLSHFYEEKVGFVNQIDFTVLGNRLYLDYYKRPFDFWRDLVECFGNMEAFNGYKENDVGVLINRLKVVAKVLFGEWVDLHQKEIDELTAFNSRNYNYDSFRLFTETVFKISNKTVLKENMKKTLLEVKGCLKTFCDFIVDVGSFDERVNGMQKIVDEYESVTNKEEEKINKEEKNSKEDIKTINNNNVNNDNKEETIKEQNNIITSNHKEENQQRPPSSYINETRMDENFKVFVNFLNEIQIELDNSIQKFEDLFKKQQKAKTLDIYTPIRTSLGWLNDSEEPDTSFVPPDLLPISITSPPQTKYLIKWKHLSYSDTTWEKKSDIENFQSALKDFNKFNKALDKTTRKIFTLKNDCHRRLLELYRLSLRKPNRANSALVSDIKRKLFTYKDSKKLFQYQPDRPPSFKEGRRLRPYQLESLNWLVQAWTKRTNVILADEMGLGKTIQAMAFVNHLITFEKQLGCYLILAPLSTLPHWLNVFNDWSGLNCVLYYDSGGKAGRAKCREFEWFRADITMKGLRTKQSRIFKPTVIITSFEVFLQDFEDVFVEMPIQHVIIDEAHRLKNKNAKIITVLNRLVCRRFLLLTGTPIQNNIGELWSLLHFIEPNRFGDLKDFERQFGDLKQVEQLNALKEILRPFLLRRMKEDVEASIPPLQETIIDVELTKLQKIVYKTIYEKNKGTLQRGIGLQYVSQMNNLELQLRKCCNHPFLIQDIKDNLINECHTAHAYYEKLLNSSGKMILLDKMIHQYRTENKKVLIFSQFTEMLKVIEEYLASQRVIVEKIDGSTKARERQMAIDRFNSPQSGFGVFLLSTKAGGIGINLTSAKIVIIYDSDWNPQNDVQAIARAHRIGQTDEVRVFRLISKKTYEVEMFERASKKLGLDQAVFLTSNFDAKQEDKGKNEDMTKLDPAEVELLLRKGMVGLLEEEDKDVAGQFNMNLDEIIKNARVANYSFIKGTYTFAKSNFNSNAKDAKYQIDDPDFWKKVFVNSDNPGKKILKKYKEMNENNSIKILDKQKKLFLELSKEICAYLENRVKSEGFCADTENCFTEVLNELVENISINKVLKELLEQLSVDFEKKSRRIKKIDEKNLNAILKKNTRRREIIQREEEEESSESAQKPQKKKRQPKQEKPKQEKPEKIEKEEKIEKRPKSKRLRKKVNQSKLKLIDESDNDIFEDKASTFKVVVKRPRPTNKKKAYCEICGLFNPRLNCQGICSQDFHEDCLAKQVQKNTVELLNVTIQTKTPLIPMNASVCIYCQNNVAACFKCKKIDKIEKSVKNFRKNEKSNTVLKCKKCNKFYHFNCFVPGSDQRSGDFICNLHFCGSCNEFADKLNVCISCPIAFHKKCMSKRNEVIKGNRIKCQLHFNKKDKIKEKKEDLNIYKIALKTKRNKITGNTEEAFINKRVKLKTFSSEKGEVDCSIYERFGMVEPGRFDYSKSKQVG